MRERACSTPPFFAVTVWIWIHCQFQFHTSLPSDRQAGVNFKPRCFTFYVFYLPTIDLSLILSQRCRISILNWEELFEEKKFVKFWFWKFDNWRTRITQTWDQMLCNSGEHTVLYELTGSTAVLQLMKVWEVKTGGKLVQTRCCMKCQPASEGEVKVSTLLMIVLRPASCYPWLSHHNCNPSDTEQSFVWQLAPLLKVKEFV